MLLRVLRIPVVAIGFVLIFALSRHATAARGGEDLPGISWALGVLALLFLTRAAVTERFHGPQDNLQKDLLWGLGAGSLLIIMARC